MKGNLTMPEKKTDINMKKLVLRERDG